MFRKAILALGCAVASAAFAAPTGTIWYNGDFDGQNGLYSSVGNSTATTYQNFEVPAGGWHVTGVFGYFLVGAAGNGTVEWDIRSGVSFGNGGTSVASGTGPGSVTPTGNTAFAYDEYLAISAPFSLDLAPGTYWLGIRPVIGSNQGYVETTSEVNSIGLPGGYVTDAYFDGAAFGANFDNAGNQVTPGEFSVGLINSVPEPSSMALVLCGAMVLVRRSRKTT